MQCNVCLCLTYFPTRLSNSSNHVLCEACQLQDTRDYYFRREDAIGTIEDHPLIEPPGEVEEIEEKEERYRCCHCETTKFTLPISCLCQKVIACEECYETTPAYCSSCHTTPAHLFVTLITHFNEHNRYKCTWCKKKVSVEEYVEHHLKSDVYCVPDRRKAVVAAKREKMEILLLQRGREAIQKEYTSVCDQLIHENSPFKSQYRSLEKKTTKLRKKRSRITSDDILSTPAICSKVATFSRRLNVHRIPRTYGFLYR